MAAPAVGDVDPVHVVVRDEAVGDVDVAGAPVHVQPSHVVVGLDRGAVQVDVAPHLFHPHTPPVVVGHHRVGEVEVGVLVQAGRDLQKNFGLDPAAEIYEF